VPLKTPLIETHRSSCATMGEFFGTILPVRFDDYSAEYTTLRESVGLIDTNFRAFFSLTGPDRQRYLNAILTSNVRDQKPGQGAVGLLLNPQGHILAEVETLLRDDSILAASHAMVLQRTYSTLDKFIIMDDVALEDVTEKTGTVDLTGPRTAALLSECGADGFADLPLYAHGEITVGEIACRAVRHELAGKPAAMIVAPRESLPALWRELSERVRRYGGAPAGMEALNSLRLEYGTPWFGEDFGDQQIPHEVGLERSHISYEKGCYTGQEIVERVRSRGHVNRRLALLQFDPADAPARESKLFAGGTEVGCMTSTGFSPHLDRTIGLGYLRREHSALGAKLDASGIPAEVIAPPLASRQISA
jgi:folate-binding protein YgfZ